MMTPPAELLFCTRNIRVPDDPVNVSDGRAAVAARKVIVNAPALVMSRSVVVVYAVPSMSSRISLAVSVAGSAANARSTVA